jgi:hypothetical protein
LTVRTSTARSVSAGQPGGRTGVAPISLSQSNRCKSASRRTCKSRNFISAAVNAVTRSGTNALTASVYHRYRRIRWNRSARPRGD